MANVGYVNKEVAKMYGIPYSELTPEQKRACQKMLIYDTGVLAATTAFGKTVVAANIIAARKTRFCAPN